MTGGLLGPPADTLLAAHCLHEDPQEISNVPAFFEHPCLNIASLQAGSGTPLAAQPEIQQASPSAYGS
jgi:hypothetical protein